MIRTTDTVAQAMRKQAASVELVKDVRKFEAFKKMVLAEKEKLSSRLLKNVGKFIVGLEVVAVILGGGQMMWAIANPNAQQERHFEAFLWQYREAMKGAIATGTISNARKEFLADSAANYLRSIGVDDKIANTIQLGGFVQRAL